MNDSIKATTLKDCALAYLYGYKMFTFNDNEEPYYLNGFCEAEFWFEVGLTVFIEVR